MKFSIIVPVYNAENYLKRCVNSIKKQTYKDWELIMIDDGSCDKSWLLMQNLQQDDSRIKIYRQANKGPGITRNVGIENARGDYVVFIDADDYVDFEYLELIEPLTKKNDLIFIDVLQTNKNGKILKEEKMSIYKDLTKDKILKAMMTGMIPWGGVRKVVNVNLLNQYNIRYSDLKIGEEALFSFKTLLYSKSFDFLDEKPVYKYEIHEDSQSNIVDDDPWGGTYEVIKRFIKDNGIYERYAEALNAFNVSSTVVSINRIILNRNYNLKEIKHVINKRIYKYKKRIDKNYKVDISVLSKKVKLIYFFIKIHFIFPIILLSKMYSLIKK